MLNNELRHYPGFFTKPTATTGLVEIPLSKRRAFCDVIPAESDDEVSLYLDNLNYPTHVLASIAVWDMEVPRIAPDQLKVYMAVGDLAVGDVFVAKGKDGESCYYTTLQDFNYFDMEAGFVDNQALVLDDWLIDTGMARYEARHSAIEAFHAQPTYRIWSRTFPLADTTPGYRWRVDPFSGRYDDPQARAKLPHGDRTDYELANEVFMADVPGIALTTAVKERIRWLSRRLAIVSGDTSGTTIAPSVLVGKAELNLVLNHLRRQAEEGRVSAGEILETVIDNVEFLNN